MNSKLVNELPELVKKQVISEEVALKIRDYYQSQEQDAPNKLFMVFGILGSLLVGLGIILILAHNWDDLSRGSKTIFAFLPLVFGQILAGYSILKKKSATWKESSGVLLFLAVGSSIALVSQIYNIPGDMMSYILTWIVLCLPLIYLLKSNAVTILHLVFSTFYACYLGYGLDGGAETPWIFLLLFGVLMPRYLQLLKEEPEGNLTSIFSWLLPLSIIITLGTFLERNGDIGYLMYVIMFGLFYNIGKLPRFDNLKLRQNGYVIFGSVGMVIVLLMTSFNWIWEFHLESEWFQSREFFVTLILFSLTLGLLIYLYSKGWVKRFNLFHFVFIIFTFLFFIGINFQLITTILINLLVLALGLITIKIGTDKYHFGILNYGLLIITSLVICRFFDTNMSYVIRGLLFVAVGIGFFLANYVMIKRKKEVLNEKKSEL